MSILHVPLAPASGAEVAGSAPEDPAAAQVAPQLPAEMQGLTLYGVVIVEPGSRMAFIQDGSRRGQIRKVLEGQTIAGALVKTIQPDRVILVNSGGETRLMLRSMKAGAPAGIASAPAGEASPPTGMAHEAADMAPRPLNSSDLSLPLIKRQPLYAQ